MTKTDLESMAVELRRKVMASGSVDRIEAMCFAALTKAFDAGAEAMREAVVAKYEEFAEHHRKESKRSTSADARVGHYIAREAALVVVDQVSALEPGELRKAGK